MAVEKQDGLAAPDVGAAKTEVVSDNSTRTTSSIQLGRDQEKTQPLENEPAEKFVQETRDPEKAEQVVENAAPVPPPYSMPPDGGWEAWLVVAGGFCALFVSFGWINCEFLETQAMNDMSDTEAKLTKNK